LLRPRGSKPDFLSRVLDLGLGWLFRLFNRAFEHSTALYTRAVGGVLRVSAITLFVYGALLFLTAWSFKHWPAGFLPLPDPGYLSVTTRLADGASVQRTQEVIAQIDKIARGDPKDPERYPGIPGIKHTVTIAGVSLLYNANSPNWGSMFIILDDFERRETP